MKMHEALTALGYGAELIQREKDREGFRSLQFPDFPFSIYRSMEGPGDGEIELAIEVRHYRQGTVLKPGQYMSPSDPAFDPGEVSFGMATVVATGKTMELTEMEWEACETAFWDQ